ncbi:helical backbone metal receptor [Halobacterium salinarum]|uniref:PGF-CTERM-anchored ABC transporter substrate-binding protein n=1 Tax=Halobacterium TaxID=2239 RepID=UPI001964EF77|nr:MULTISPECIES: PGF-CTERM-anchored ABC transporter substrate-binding protein [Halobacterium]MCF2165205.1 helical backbone metal receptor [Halobacterium salinarum]MCF2167986.1 helical backbone metal receptor [Halobacterium salinarum]MCF2238692.1 helical backbone metal receptor [Halobacterium salinarum]QRY23742.1 ABC transporter substrate-binding protein [Halobacterium sp. GSL-19]
MHRGRFATLVIVALAVTMVVPAGAFAPQPPAQHADADRACSFPVTEPDASNTAITLDSEPERVVTLNPSAAQTMWELGDRDAVVGVSQFGTYLPTASQRTVVSGGQPSQTNVEAVVGLDPDLVLAPNTVRNTTVTRLRSAGITVFQFRAATSIDGVVEKTATIGRLTGNCAAAAATTAEMRDRVAAIADAVPDTDSARPRVYYHLGDGYTAGPNTFIGAAIEAAGGHNIAADVNTTSPYPQLSEEVIVSQDPDVVVTGVSADRLDATASALVAPSSVVRNTTAYATGNVVAVNTNHINQPAPRIVEPMARMANAFHNTTINTTLDAQPSATTTAASTTPPTDAADGTAPGFGVAAAVCALAGAALVARR